MSVAGLAGSSGIRAAISEASLAGGDAVCKRANVCGVASAAAANIANAVRLGESSELFKFAPRYLHRFQIIWKGRYARKRMALVGCSKSRRLRRKRNPHNLTHLQ